MDKRDPATSDSEKILAAYDRQRARHYLNDILMPLLRNAVKKDKAQDRAGSSEAGFLVQAVHGASVEDENAKRFIN